MVIRLGGPQTLWRCSLMFFCLSSEESVPFPFGEYREICGPCRLYAYVDGVVQYAVVDLPYRFCDEIMYTLQSIAPIRRESGIRIPP